MTHPSTVRYGKPADVTFTVAKGGYYLSGARLTISYLDPDFLRNEQWTGLTDKDEIKNGLELLLDHGHIIRQERQTSGRTAEEYILNPKARG